MARKITALKVQKRNRERVNIYLDGEFAFGLARIVAAWLQVGQELSDEKITELQAQDGLELAYQKALNFLGYRTRSENEVREHLLRKEAPPSVVEPVLARLKLNGLINDTQFAASWIDNRATFRPRSRQALAFELRQKGLAENDIQQALQEYSDEEAAYAAASRQARKYLRFDLSEFRRKMNAFLARRGFSYEVADSAARRVWEDNSASRADEGTSNEHTNIENEVGR